MSEGTSKSSVVVRDLLSGFVSGFACKFVEHPFDTIKVLMQVNKNSVYKNSLDCLKKTVSLYGIQGLYRGIQFPLIGSIAENGLTFVSYSYFKKLLGVKDSNTMTITQMALSSMGSGATISFLLTPVELLKCRIQVEQSYNNEIKTQSRKKTTTIGVIRNAVREDGILGIFRGLHLTLMREIPGTCIWFMAYEIALKPFYVYGYHRDDIPLSGIIAAGSISGATYWSIIYPIDTLKSIVQTDPMYNQHVHGTGFAKWKELSKYLVKTMKELGLKGVYKGLGLTMVRAIPTNAVLFMGYEYAFRFFSKYL